MGLEALLADLYAPTSQGAYENETACGIATEFVREIPHRQSLADTRSTNRDVVAAVPAGSIGPYELLEKIGQGGMGSVYKALHTRLDKVVALKVLPAGRMKDAAAVRRFEREMKAVGRLDHPNIVGAMDAGDVDGTHFLVMEYVPGIDLARLSKQLGPLPIAEACELIRQAALGLQEAHAHGVVHRDIKPGNLMLAVGRPPSPVAQAGELDHGDATANMPTVKILDMGLAQFSNGHDADEGLTGTGQLMGTLDYMAPEQGDGSKNVDHRADVYALGASLYRLLCGEVIFPAAAYPAPVKKMMALATEPAPAIQQRRSDVPAALAAVVHRMTAKDPAVRYATAQGVADALAPFAAGADLRRLLRPDAPGGFTDGGAFLQETSPSEFQPALETNTTLNQPYSRGEPGTPAPETASATPKTAEAYRRPRRKPLAFVGLYGLGAIMALALAAVFFFQTPTGTLRVEINDPEVVVRIKGKDITLRKAETETIALTPGEHALIVQRGDFRFETHKLALKRGETATVKVDWMPGRVQVVQNDRVIGSRAFPPPSPDEGPTEGAERAMVDGNHVAPPTDGLTAGQQRSDNGLAMPLVWCPPGRFTMGSPPDERFRHDDGTEDQVAVTIRRGFWLGKYEVTQSQWQVIMGTRPWRGKAYVLEGGGNPATYVNWHDAMEFCRRLSEQERRAGRLGEDEQYTLPSEAQWEYACRAGTTTAMNFGDSPQPLRRYAWFNENTVREGRPYPQPVGEKFPNTWNLHDMHGNVHEWCRDGATHPRSTLPGGKDPLVQPEGRFRITRGHGFNSFRPELRSAKRGGAPADWSSFQLGFRVARTADAASKSMP